MKKYSKYVFKPFYCFTLKFKRYACTNLCLCSILLLICGVVSLDPSAPPCELSCSILTLALYYLLCEISNTLSEGFLSALPVPQLPPGILVWPHFTFEPFVSLLILKSQGMMHCTIYCNILKIFLYLNHSLFCCCAVYNFITALEDLFPDVEPAWSLTKYLLTKKG